MDQGKENFKIQERKIEAPNDGVILQLVDDNIYDNSVIKTEGGIGLIKNEIVADTYEYKGRVVAVGPKVNSDIKVGDLVHHAKHAGTIFTFNGENYLFLQEYLFLAIERK